MSFDITQGILVADPIEGRGIRARSIHPQVYVLFEIGTKVQRTKITTAESSLLMKWKEDSQCKLDIQLDMPPILKVSVMEYRKPLPLCLAQGELDLIDVFYEKESSRIISLNPCGQLELELTYYDIVPMLPKKSPESPPPVAINDEAKVSKVRKLEQLVSSVDQVFVDDVVEKERSRLKRLVKGVKRRYQKSRSHYPEQSHRRQSIRNLLQLQAQVDLEGSGDSTDAESRPNTPHSSSGTIFSRTSVELTDLSTPKLEELDINSLPFSAGSIGTNEPQKTDVLRKQYEKKRVERIEYNKFLPEVYAFLDRLQKGNAWPEDFDIERGVSEYNGDGTWSRGCLRDSVQTDEPPMLPPKVPMGMTGEEYFVLQKEQCIDYFKTVYSGF
jgi:hypothetical protein